jgi:hypothetical protein
MVRRLKIGGAEGRGSAAGTQARYDQQERSRIGVSSGTTSGVRGICGLDPGVARDR